MLKLMLITLRLCLCLHVRESLNWLGRFVEALCTSSSTLGGINFSRTTAQLRPPHTHPNETEPAVENNLNWNLRVHILSDRRRNRFRLPSEHRAPSFRFFGFLALRHTSEIVISYSIRQLPFSVSEWEWFGGAPRGSSMGSSSEQWSVAALCDWVRDLLRGGHREPSRRNGWRARGKWSELKKRERDSHSSSTNHHYPPASRCSLRNCLRRPLVEF